MSVSHLDVIVAPLHCLQPCFGSPALEAGREQPNGDEDTSALLPGASGQSHKKIAGNLALECHRGRPWKSVPACALVGRCRGNQCPSVEEEELSTITNRHQTSDGGVSSRRKKLTFFSSFMSHTRRFFETLRFASNRKNKCLHRVGYCTVLCSRCTHAVELPSKRSSTLGTPHTVLVNHAIPRGSIPHLPPAAIRAARVNRVEARALAAVLHRPGYSLWS